MSKNHTQPQSQTAGSLRSPALYPKLRFPGFDGVWEEKKLGDIFSNKAQRNRNQEGVDVLTNSATQGIVNQRDYFDKDIAIQGSLENYYVVDINDFIYNPRISNFAPVGPLKRNKLKKGVMSPLYTVLKPKQGDLTFLEKYFETSNWYRYMYKIANYGARHDRMAILQTDFMKMPVPFPPFLEQQKIASFLGSVDEWVTNLRAQHAELAQYKKGMMQKIFSQQIRFKDENGNDFPEWEEKRLGEVGNILTGTTPSTTNPNYYGGEFLWVTPTDINENKDIFSSVKLLTKAGLEKGRFIPRDSLLVTCIASIGKNAILRIDGSCNQQINAITPNKENDVDFIYYLINQKNNILLRFASAGGMAILNKTDFSKLKFYFPSLPEQQKIAEFLSSVDQLLESKQQQITEAENWKKGLMQGVFV
jgi:type I restriction enzyme S subunit